MVVDVDIHKAWRASLPLRELVGREQTQVGRVGRILRIDRRPAADVVWGEEAAHDPHHVG